jgi:large subunit ribosomal protein L15
MALKLRNRLLRSSLCSVCARSACSNFSITPASALKNRLLSTSNPSRDGAQAAEIDKPRWSYTPPTAKAPFSLHLNSRKTEFPVNDDPAVLDQFYLKALGNGGDKLLSDEIKWLAITHKSFDQGRRGFNDRLAFLGM